MTKKWVLYHDDFDGMASAALLTLIARRNHETFTHYKSIDYNQDLNWNAEIPNGIDGGDDFSVVDFQFHPYAWYWVDHHQNPFRYPFFDDLYDARKMMDDWRVLWDAAARSCAGLLHRTYFPPFVDPTNRLAPLVAAADMIDQAAFPSVQAYFEAADPAIAMAHGHTLMSEGQKTEVIRRFIDGTVADAYEVVRSECEQGVERSKWARERCGDRAELFGQVVVTDLVDQQIPYPRYAAFYYYPKALYQVTLYSAGESIRASVTKNPWISFDHMNLQELVAPAGGGGHAYAAAVEFRTGFAYGEALLWSRRWITQLNTLAQSQAA